MVLECYLRNKAARNVPEAITDKYTLQTILKRGRINDLKKVQSDIHFLRLEPLLGQVNWIWTTLNGL